MDYADSEYLSSQEGVLTLDSIADSHYITKGKFPDFLLNIRDLTPPKNFNRYDGSPAFRKFTLPVSEVKELVRLLYIEGVHRAALMPTLDNVARTLKLRWELTRDKW